MNKLLFILVLVLIFAMSIGVFASTNVVLNKPVTANDYIAESEHCDFLVDGDYGKKWCTNATEEIDWAIIDLQGEFVVDSYKLVNASAATEPEPDYLNTDSWNLYVSDDGENWTVVDQVEVNVEGIYEASFEPVAASYIKLEVPVANPVDAHIRIYELEVYGTASVPQTSDAGSLIYVGLAIISAGAVMKLRKK